MPQTSTIVAVTSESAVLSRYWFLGVSAGTTITGFFIDKLNLRVGNSFSVSVPQGTGSNNQVQLATSFPDGAVGAIVRFSGNTAFDLNSSASADFKANAATTYPIFTNNVNVALGDVAVV